MKSKPTTYKHNNHIAIHMLVIFCICLQSESITSNACVDDIVVEVERGDGEIPVNPEPPCVENYTGIDSGSKLEYVERNANKGNAEAQWMLGAYYLCGESGLPEDYEQAFLWFSRAAKQGYAQSQLDLGRMYYYGWGVIQDYELALKWYALAAEQGLSGAQFELGDLYYRGQGGVATNFSCALNWYTKAAEQDNPVAAYVLGKMHYFGIGTSSNHEKAFKWYKTAAELGVQPAQIIVSLMYHNGDGVVQNQVESYAWALLAKNSSTTASIGLDDARLIISLLYQNGITSDQVSKLAISMLISESTMEEIMKFVTEPLTKKQIKDGELRAKKLESHRCPASRSERS